MEILSLGLTFPCPRSGFSWGITFSCWMKMNPGAGSGNLGFSAPRDGVSAIFWEINGEITTFPANKPVCEGGAVLLTDCSPLGRSWWFLFGQSSWFGAAFGAGLELPALLWSPLPHPALMSAPFPSFISLWFPLYLFTSTFLYLGMFLFLYMYFPQKILLFELILALIPLYHPLCF